MNDYKVFYSKVKPSLEEFLKEYFNVDSFQDPSNVAFYDGKYVHNVLGEVSKNEAEELLEDDLGVYAFGTVVVRIKGNLEETLVHELLHHVGNEISELEVLSSDEYLTQLLTNAYMKWKHPDYSIDDGSNYDVIKIYLDDYGIADSDARNKSVDEIVSMFRSKNPVDDYIPIVL